MNKKCFAMAKDENISLYFIHHQIYLINNQLSMMHHQIFQIEK